MNRPTKTIKLSGYEVDVITYLTWGENEKIQAKLISGAMLNNSGLSGFDSNAYLESKYALLEIAVKEIRKGEEKKPFSREWVNNLSVSDGNKLYETVDELTKKKE